MDSSNPYGFSDDDNDEKPTRGKKSKTEHVIVTHNHGKQMEEQIAQEIEKVEQESLNLLLHTRQSVLMQQKASARIAEDAEDLKWAVDQIHKVRATRFANTNNTRFSNTNTEFI